MLPIPLKVCNEWYEYRKYIHHPRVIWFSSTVSKYGLNPFFSHFWKHDMMLSRNDFTLFLDGRITNTQSHLECFLFNDPFLRLNLISHDRYSTPFRIEISAVFLSFKVNPLSNRNCERTNFILLASLRFRAVAIKSSAYRTVCHLFFLSLYFRFGVASIITCSMPSKARLQNSGDTKPPCGVPFTGYTQSLGDAVFFH